MEFAKSTKVAGLAAAIVMASWGGAAAAQNDKDVEHIRMPGVVDSVKNLATDLSDVQVDRAVEMPINGIVAVETGGETIFMSSNGRFVFQGNAHDIWYDHTLRNNMDNVITSSTKVDLERLGIDSSKMNTLTIGNGHGEDPITVFVDPRNDGSRNYVEAATKLKDDYTFHFVMIPALGKESARLSHRYACRAESVTHEQATQAFISGQIGDIPANEQCQSDSFDVSVALAEILRIDGVPYSISHAGNVARGALQPEWIESQL